MIKNNLQVTNHDFLIYKDSNGEVKVKVMLINNDLWLSQKLMAELFDCSSDNIGVHLKNIYLDEELDKNSITEEISVAQKEGNREVKCIFKI